MFFLYSGSLAGFPVFPSILSGFFLDFLDSWAFVSSSWNSESPWKEIDSLVQVAGLRGTRISEGREQLTP